MIDSGKLKLLLIGGDPPIGGKNPPGRRQRRRPHFGQGNHFFWLKSETKNKTEILMNLVSFWESFLGPFGTIFWQIFWFFFDWKFKCFFIVFRLHFGGSPNPKSGCFVKDILQKSIKLRLPKKTLLQGLLGLPWGSKIRPKIDSKRSWKLHNFGTRFWSTFGSLLGAQNGASSV